MTRARQIMLFIAISVVVIAFGAAFNGGAGV